MAPALYNTTNKPHPHKKYIYILNKRDTQKKNKKEKLKDERT